MLVGLPHAVIYAHLAAVTLGFALITYLHVLLGELVPKSLALRRVEQMAIAVAGPMIVFITVTRPAVRLLKNSARLVLMLFGAPMTHEAQVHSPEELKLITTAAREMGVVPAFQERLIHRALELDELPLREIMTPRQKIIALPSDMLIEEASAQVIDHQHSRVPVYDETRGPEHIIGVVYAKDLARLMHFRRTAGTRAAAAPIVEMRLSQLMRDVLMVPETKTVLDLIQDLQRRRRQMAIVVDEYGSTVGLVTVEDAIEQLTGELHDEFDDPARPVLTTASGALLLEGSVNLRDLETQMQWSLPRDGGVETLAGFVLMRLGHIPRGGEWIEYEGRKMTVTEMDGRRIARIRVEPVEV
jgi:CBS domain containing-hemolysin-like protein